MTVSSLYKRAALLLRDVSPDDYKLEADCLVKAVTGMDRQARIIKPDAEITTFAEEKLIELVSKRRQGVPLQYLIGKWDFMGYEFEVGDGVLIPRPETELLVETALDYIRDKDNAVVFDLCAGSGAIGLSIAGISDKSEVWLFEKYNAAFDYLERNNRRLSLKNTKLLNYDIFNGFDSAFKKPDIIVSNPPYVKTDEIPFLQKEVGFEPVSALDGGSDGLDFYRCIFDKWLTALDKGSLILLECGDNQSGEVYEIFRKHCSDIGVIYDFNGIDRLVKIYV